MKGLLKILRKRGGNRHVFFQRGMGEGHASGVERVAGEAFVNPIGKWTVEYGQPFDPFPPSAVRRIAQHREAAACAMHADLVHPAGVQSQLEYRNAAAMG